jgi:hypothetical protein
MVESLIKIEGYWTMRLHGPDGALKQEVSGKNVITTNGKEALASYLAAAAAGATENPFKYVAVGTGSVAESAADTALGGELSRKTGVASYVSGAIYQVSATFAAGVATGAITEYGLFNTSTGGTLFSRDIETVINKGASDTLSVTTQVTLS